MTEAQAFEFANELERLVQEQDSEGANALVNAEFMAMQAIQKLDYPPEVAEAYKEAGSETQPMLTSVLEHVGDLGGYQFLRLRKEGDEYYPVFRLVQNTGGFAYHHFKLVQNDEGNPVARDFKTSVFGDWMEEVTQEAVKESFSIRDERGRFVPSAQGRLLQKHVSTFYQMAQALRTGEGGEDALQEFRNLPEQLQGDKRFLLIAIGIAGGISVEELEVEIARFRKHHPNRELDEALLLPILNRLKQTDEALQVIQLIDDRVGGDPFLDHERAIAFLEADRLDDAYAAIERVRASLPNLYPTYATSLLVAARRKDFAKITDLLRQIEEVFAGEVDIEYVLSYEAFDEFRISEEYEKYAKEE